MKGKDFLILATALCSLFFNCLSAQEKPEIFFTKKQTHIVEPNEDAKQVQVAVQLEAQGGDPSNYPVQFQIADANTGSAESGDYKFSNGQFQIDKDGGKTTVWVTINSDEKAEANETVVLAVQEDQAITRGKNNIHEILIVDVPTSQTVRLTTGVDFDFENTDETPISFYGELNGFMPDLRSTRVGISFSLFSNHFSSTDSMLSSEKFTFITGSEIVEGPDTSLPIKNIYFGPVERGSTRNYGMDLSLLIRIAPFSNSNGDTKLFLAPLYRGMISATTRTYSYDTLSVRPDTVTRSEFDALNVRNRFIVASRRNLFVNTFAITLPFQHITEEYEIRIIPGIGRTLVIFPGPDKQGGQISNGFWSYMLDMSILDRNFGITIGGGVRTDNLVSDLPFINLYIAKSFNFSNFTQF